MASRRDISTRQSEPPHQPLPKFMPPVTLDSYAPHPYLPLQPDKSQFIIHPKQPFESAQSPSSDQKPQPPKNILAAAKSGSLGWVKRYSEAGQTELADSMGETALLKASEMGHSQIVEYLIQIANANVTHTDTDGWTALHNASAKGHIEIVRLLVSSGRANVNSQSRSTGYTSLMTAASRNHTDVLEFLICLPSVDLFIRNHQNETVYDIAAERGDLETCKLIEQFERVHWAEGHPNEQYDPVTIHTVVPCTVVENARVNTRSRNPDPRLLVPHIDPPRFTPSRKEDITLPQSVDPSLEWVWMSNWSVSRNERTSDMDGWRYAQRWDVPKDQWVSNPALISPTSRSGLVCRRLWVRNMRKCPAGQGHIGDIGTSSGSEEPDLTITSEDSSGKATEPVDRRPRPQPTRTNSMGARLVDLEESSENTPDAADESEVDEVFSTRARSLITITPASSFHEVFDESQYGFAPDANEIDTAAHSTETAQGHRHTQSSSSSRYPRRIGIGESSMPPTAPEGSRQFRNEQGAGGGNDGDGDPRDYSPTWEPDENVLVCRLCSRRFTAFLRRHHCRFCGRVVCYRCSTSRHEIPHDRVVQNPFNGSDDGLQQPRLHRVCDTCVPLVLALTSVDTITEESNSAPEVFDISSPEDVATPLPESQDSTGSEQDDRSLIECPVCRADLRVFGDEDLQAVHVATCLEEHSTGASFSGGSRHLVYLLQEGSPLIGVECVICFEEFEVGDRISRTECLCNFHRRCFRDWIRFGNGCPVHFIRS